MTVKICSAQNSAEAMLIVHRVVNVFSSKAAVAPAYLVAHRLWTRASGPACNQTREAVRWWAVEIQAFFRTPICGLTPEPMEIQVAQLLESLRCQLSQVATVLQLLRSPARSGCLWS